VTRKTPKEDYDRRSHREDGLGNKRGRKKMSSYLAPEKGITSFGQSHNYTMAEFDLKPLNKMLRRHVFARGWMGHLSSQLISGLIVKLP